MAGVFRGRWNYHRPRRRVLPTTATTATGVAVVAVSPAHPSRSRRLRDSTFRPVWLRFRRPGLLRLPTTTPDVAVLAIPTSHPSRSRRLRDSTFRPVWQYFRWQRRHLFLPSSTTLGEAQKSLDTQPAFSLFIGSHDLSAYLLAYLYEEAADAVGGLSVWLDNRGGSFSDLASNWPEVVEGAVVNFERGLVINGAAVTLPLQRTWVESFDWLPGGQLLITCFNLVQRLSKFYFDTDQIYSGVTHRAIADDVLSNVGMSVGGEFGYDTEFVISRFESGWEALRRLTGLCHEKIYMDKSGSMSAKRLASDEAAGYAYDFENGTSGNHPALYETEIQQASALYNTVTVTGGSAEEYSYTATDAAQASMVGTRRYPLHVRALTSDSECQEVAEAWLDRFLAGIYAGVVVARPNFSLRLYDVVSVAAPPWGGPAISAGRVTAFSERYSSYGNRYDQILVLGDVPFQLLSQRARMGELG